MSLIVEMWFKPPSRYSVQNTQGAETNSTLKTLTCVAVLAAFFIGIFGPKFAFNFDFTQAIETIHIQQTSIQK